jgi:chromatin segregation and condensation protein Rec8/ScpA/Scc1 (kleisin family)
MAEKPRDYKEEYQEYHGTKDQRERRAARNKARRHLESQGRVHKNDGKDVDHKNGNPRDNSPANIRVMSRSANRAKH